MNQNDDWVNPEMITTRKGLETYLIYLSQHVGKYVREADRWTANDYRGEMPALNEVFVVSIIEAIALRAPFFMLPNHFVHMVDEHLIPRAMMLSDEHRGELATSLVLQLFQVAGETFTNLERGWRRIQVAEIAFDCEVRGVDCGEDPRRHFAAAVRLSRMCYREVGGPELWAKVEELSQRYNIPIEVV